MAHEANAVHATVAEVQHEPAHAQEGNPLLRLDPGMAFWTWVVFFLFLAILGWKAWKPILKILDEREAKIKKSLDDAEKARLALEEAAQRQDEIIARAQKESNDIIQKSRESAQNVAVEIEEKARKESERIVDGARRAIESQRQEAVARLRREAADIAVMAASKLIQSNLDDAKNRKLVDGYIKEIAG